ncbi:MAG: hypothetical protein EA343_18305 [Nodularia sp. (in: Bacteria)]|nr:MAG: hypothetical protein EA343_18305 [Nodularia sp. (in: cyanobacteria)]
MTLTYRLSPLMSLEALIFGISDIFGLTSVEALETKNITFVVFPSFNGGDGEEEQPIGDTK